MSRESQRRLATALVREHVMARDRFTCQYCRRPATDMAHIVTRSSRYLKWEPLNLVALCHEDHDYFGRHPAQWRRWIGEHYGPDRYDLLRRMQAEGERRGGSVDLDEVIRCYRIPALASADREAYEDGVW